MPPSSTTWGGDTRRCGDIEAGAGAPLPSITTTAFASGERSSLALGARGKKLIRVRPSMGRKARRKGDDDHDKSGGRPWPPFGTPPGGASVIRQPFQLGGFFRVRRRYPPQPRRCSGSNGSSVAMPIF